MATATPNPAPNPPLPIQPAPDPLDTELALLLGEPFASAWADAVQANGQASALPARLASLQKKLQASRDADAGMVTVRRSAAARHRVADGVTRQDLYAAASAQALRPGEPLRACLITLAPGASFGPAAPATSATSAGATGLHREWLVVSGQAHCDGQALSLRDYRVQPAGQPTAQWSSDSGALLFLRESMPAPQPAVQPQNPPVQPAFTVRDRDTGWPEFAPGIRRRVLWQQGTQAAMLYWAQPQAQVPRHRHGHDEECLMLQGELFLNDLLLQTGDYQLAPAGTGHRITETDTGAVIYAHGDLDLDLLPTA